MAASKNARQLALAAGFALTIAAAPIATAFTVVSTGPAPATVAACPDGQTLNPGTGECMTSAQDGSGDISYSTPGDHNSVPEVQGIPCTGSNTGECIGLQEIQDPPAVTPRATVEGAEPTP
ncbi:intersectin-EH binding protein Ibp1 [Mycobacterium sp. CVI_P3]|uniref:Intersectin-EH binding protein Ibp1 n=1 Tax=Mycobacterium pinniadriaticum TaxID=2994102 RepID=A0ABT3SH32_9MYCO|nr:intersectin-EH binding protein Ibp1 [Mycobacterium pinniadriaticum]MCX2932049.1 intersectin-EH binding protein Ibp1 [Mycobacterium pinniadriaticum]MCX2938473.1 intersectin-EH binding protein Ibp1 [Mycobacterium pinniadriaticum]